MKKEHISFYVTHWHDSIVKMINSHKILKVAHNKYKLEKFYIEHGGPQTLSASQTKILDYSWLFLRIG